MVDGRYRVEGAVGQGGVGCVYRALQLKLNRAVAMKMLLDESLGEENQRPRFEREAMALAALSHPNIVSVQDYGVWRGRPFLVMEMLEGQSLRDRMDQGPMDPQEAFRITRDLLHALAYAHSKGVVHRDLKPANIFLQSFPTQLDHVKVLDFGFAKFVDDNALADAPALTVAGTTMGTPAYISPEALYGGKVDARADLYSVGILLFEMLAGEKPFDGEVSNILRAHLADPVPKLSDRNPRLCASEALQGLFERALEKAADHRYPSAAAMLAALDALPLPVLWPAGEAPPAVAPGAADTPQGRAPVPTPLSADGGGPLGRLMDRENLRAMGSTALDRTRRGTQRLRHWVEQGVRWAWPRIRRAAARLGQQLRRQGQARGAPTPGHESSHASSPDGPSKAEAPTQLLGTRAQDEAPRREPTGSH